MNVNLLFHWEAADESLGVTELTEDDRWRRVGISEDDAADIYQTPTLTLTSHLFVVSRKLVAVECHAASFH